MEKEFIPYGLALKMKQLGFDEVCLAWFNTKSNDSLSFCDLFGFVNEHTDEDFHINSKDLKVSAPTWQAAFAWFREEHNLIASVWQIGVGIENGLSSFEYMIDKLNNLGLSQYEENFPFTSYEEAEQTCLEKLIEILEQKQK